jgi:TRAP-type mannitol/chloroaromatic compound transport system permease small subunit
MVRKAGELASWLSLVLVILICSDVFLRYVFSATKTWVIELEWHVFALMFLLGAAYTYRKDQHVRVDVFYQNFSEKKKAWVNLTGITFFLLPWSLVLIYVSLKYFWQSWSVGETSPDPGGLPARYLVKFAISLGTFLLLMEAIQQWRLNWKILQKLKG